MLQALDQIPRERAEWLCWIDMDIILGDPTFTFPLDKVNYTDRDIIIWGGKKQILAGDAEYGTLAWQLLEQLHTYEQPTEAAQTAHRSASGVRCASCAHVRISTPLLLSEPGLPLQG